MKIKGKYIFGIILLLLAIGFTSTKFFHKSLVEDNKVQIAGMDLKKFDLKNTECYYENYSSYGYKKSSTKFKGFYGTQVLDSINLKKGDSVNLNFKSDIENGKFNIVVLDDKNNILKVIKPNSVGKEKMNIKEDGKYKVEMLGKNAEGKALAYWDK